MDVPEWIGVNERGGHQPPRSRYCVVNLTRNTPLAECVELADTAPARRKGLLGRSSLAPGGGLWIVPCESVHTFFMRFPIDLVYLDRKYRVRKLRNIMAPWRMSACLSAHSVLELPPGAIRASRTHCEDSLEFSPLPSHQRFGTGLQTIG